MSDREMVMQHFQDAIEASGNNNKWRFVRLDIIEKALTLLKEQEPMKPKVKHFEIHYASYDEYENRAYCPKCGIQFIQQVNYCPKCGQAVKWDD